MNTKLTGKQIDNFAKTQKELPNYYGSHIKDWSYNTPKKIYFKGAFLAKKYKDILSIVQDTNAAIKVTKKQILIKHTNGSAKIERDVLTENFLLPYLQRIKNANTINPKGSN